MYSKVEQLTRASILAVKTSVGEQASRRRCHEERGAGRHARALCRAAGGGCCERRDRSHRNPCPPSHWSRGDASERDCAELEPHRSVACNRAVVASGLAGGIGKRAGRCRACEEEDDEESGCDEVLRHWVADESD